MLWHLTSWLTGAARVHSGAPQPGLWLESRYRLRDKDERRRSAHELGRLYFALIKHLAPSLIVEIGAKTAITSRRARLRAKDARIVAFEANPLTFAAFGGREGISRCGVEYLHMALGDRDGTATFNLVDSQGTLANGRGSLLENTRRKYPLARVVDVPIRRFDSLFDLRAERNACLWIDVEGANREVLTGGGDSLAGAAVIFIEVEDREKWRGQWLYPQVARHLAGLGHVPAARDFQSRVQHNVIFLRQDIAADQGVKAVLAAYEQAAAAGQKRQK